MVAASSPSTTRLDVSNGSRSRIIPRPPPIRPPTRTRRPAPRQRDGDGVELLVAFAFGDGGVVADGAGGGVDRGLGAGAGGLEDGQDAGGGGDELGEGGAEGVEVDVLQVQLGRADGQALEVGELADDLEERGHGHALAVLEFSQLAPRHLGQLGQLHLR